MRAMNWRDCARFSLHSRESGQLCSPSSLAFPFACVGPHLEWERLFGSFDSLIFNLVYWSIQDHDSNNTRAHLNLVHTHTHWYWILRNGDPRSVPVTLFTIFSLFFFFLCARARSNIKGDFLIKTTTRTRIRITTRTRTFVRSFI